jgi:ADP-ribose pyrophosphatase YjhB (NUDIX family)
MLDLLWRVALRIAIRLLRVLWFFQRPTTRGAYVAVWWGDRLLLIRNSYRPGEAVPCGAVGRGETAVHAAIRELREETGIAASEESLRLVYEVEIPFDFKIDHAQFFELRVEREPVLRIDNREVVWAGFVRTDELADRPLIPHLRAYLANRTTSDDGPTARDDE